MDVDVALIQDLVSSPLDGDLSAVVIDVLRATTTVVSAVAAGCDGVIPVADVAEARDLAASLGRGRGRGEGPSEGLGGRPRAGASVSAGAKAGGGAGGVAGAEGGAGDGGKASAGALLAGERGGLPPEGFDLGNSPGDFTAESCAGRRVVLSTTNGTQAVRRCLGARDIWAGALINAEATARALVESGAERVLLVCAGSAGVVAADDVAAAGCLVGSLALLGAAVPADGARIAAALFDHWKHDLRGLLGRSLSGRKLEAVGLAADLVDCARVDTAPVAVRLDAAGCFRRL